MIIFPVLLQAERLTRMKLIADGASLSRCLSWYLPSESLRRGPYNKAAFQQTRTADSHNGRTEGYYNINPKLPGQNKILTMNNILLTLHKVGVEYRLLDVSTATSTTVTLIGVLTAINDAGRNTMNIVAKALILFASLRFLAARLIAALLSS